ncbi:hypothetical protein ERO13_A03G128001v2 [Gossypium hirsutum]|nr:hypothetical protein ERO13_A03G128001v2 [Gossypium hirsutum]
MAAGDMGDINGSRDVARARLWEARDRARARQKDIKERDVINGGYRSSSSRSDSGGNSSGGGSHGLRRREFSLRVVDKEPGELSSESGSEDAIESESVVKDSEVEKVMENGALSPVGRKRKFSPIVWDSDKDVSMCKSKNSPVVTVVHHPPPRPKAYHKSPKQHICQKPHSPSPVVFDGPVGYSALQSPEDLDFSPPKEHVNFQDARHLEDEDYVPARHISSSRWAAGDNSPGDEGEILEDEEIPKGEKTTPELGELKREGSEGIRARSSESDEQGARSKNDGSLSQSDTESENETNSRGTPEPSAPPLRSVNMLQGCRNVDEFERLNKIDEGTYGVVYRAKDKKTGEIVALKKVKMEKEREGFPLTSLREINILLSFHHPSIVDVKEVVVGSNLDSIFMVMEYMEHDLKGLMETMTTLLEGVTYLHDNWVLHRDLKTSNLLLNNQGELKICDFGLARQYGSPLKPYTHLVVTLWYSKTISTAIDMWSLVVLWLKLLSKEPLFNGKLEFDQLDKIFRTLGTPMDIGCFLLLPGVKRITAEAALNHEWFCEVPLPKTKAFMPTFPAQHAQDSIERQKQEKYHTRIRRMLKESRSFGRAMQKGLQQGEFGTGGLFG